MNHPEIGILQILTVGDGDTTLSFDEKNVEEAEKAKKVVVDMLKKGYAIFVCVGMRKGEPIYVRAKGFDPEVTEYLIFGISDEHLASLMSGEPLPKPRAVKKRKKASVKRIPAKETRAVAVARSAGG